MDDKNNIFSGASRLFFAPTDTADFKDLPIVANSLTYSDEDDYEPFVKPESLSFSIDIASPSKDLFAGFVAEPINKPRNLKYPNKKRPIRVQKKWFNRYIKPRVQNLTLQTKSGKTLFIPHVEPRFSLDGLTFKAIAKPSKRNARCARLLKN